MAFLLTTHPAATSTRYVMLCTLFRHCIIYTNEKTNCLHGVNMNLMQAIANYHRSTLNPIKRSISRVNLVDITANGVIIGVFREKIFEHKSLESGECKRYKVGERLSISVMRNNRRYRFANIQHFPKDQLERVLVLVNQIAQMEIQRATIAVAV